MDEVDPLPCVGTLPSPGVTARGDGAPRDNNRLK